MFILSTVTPYYVLPFVTFKVPTFGEFSQILGMSTDNTFSALGRTSLHELPV